MVLNITTSFFDILQSNGHFLSYVIIFALMFIEGPIVAYLASFAASLGYLNIWIVFLLYILGNQLPDTIIFFFGCFLRKKTVERFLEFFGLNNKRITWIEKHIKNHAIKTIYIVKLVFPIGIILAGFSKVPFKKFFLASASCNLIFAIIFTSLGYYSGVTVSNFLKYLKTTEYLVPVAIALVIILYFLIKFIYSKLPKLVK